MEKDIIEIITEKEYKTLTQEELHSISELCTNEVDFIQLKATFKSIYNLDQDVPTPRASTKNSLDDLFAKTYHKATPVWYSSITPVVIPKDKKFIQQPLLKVAAILLLLIIAVPFLTQNIEVKKDQLAEVQIKTEKKDQDLNKIEVPVVKEVESGSDATEEIQGSNQSNGIQVRSVGSSVAAIGATSGAIQPGSNHPDGVFVASVDETVSMAVSFQPDVLDLLTATF